LIAALKQQDEESEMKLLKSALVAASWLVMSAVYAQSGPATAANAQAPSQDTANAAAGQAAPSPQSPQAPRKADECVGPASFCTVFFGGS
jgi:hypothetical protein